VDVASTILEPYCIALALEEQRCYAVLHCTCFGGGAML